MNENGTWPEEITLVGRVRKREELKYIEKSFDCFLN